MNDGENIDYEQFPSSVAPILEGEAEDVTEVKTNDDHKEEDEERKDEKAQIEEEEVEKRDGEKEDEHRVEEKRSSQDDNFVSDPMNLCL